MNKGRSMRSRSRVACEDGSSSTSSESECDDETDDLIKSSNKSINKELFHKLIVASILSNCTNSSTFRSTDDKKKCTDNDSDSDDSDDEDYKPVRVKKGVMTRSGHLAALSSMRRRLRKNIVKIRGGSLMSTHERKYLQRMSVKETQILLDKSSEVTSITSNSVPLLIRVLQWNCSSRMKGLICERISRADEMEQGEGEYAKLSSWLSNLECLPIGIYTSLPVDINRDSRSKISKFLHNANTTLDNAVYGHRSAKDEIVRLCAQWIRNPSAPSQVLAIQGPMGNGKTTLVKNGIANVMHRPFVFIALGGAHDASFLNGFDYTYEGARPGRIADAVKTSGCMDPIIFFDELDKVSDTPSGKEIQNILMHLLDGSQNNHFQDRYFDGIDLDMSRALFVCSFNDPSKIDRVLLDRMRVIVTKGFTVTDKLRISKDFMIPDVMSDIGLTDNEIIIEECAVRRVIQNYTDEKGVRCLRRCIHQICAEANLRNLMDYSICRQNKSGKRCRTMPVKKHPVVITSSNVDKYVKSLRPIECSALHMYS